MFASISNTGGEIMKKYQAAAYLRLSVAGNRAAENDSIENQKYIIAQFVNEKPVWYLLTPIWGIAI